MLHGRLHLSILIPTLLIISFEIGLSVYAYNSPQVVRGNYLYELKRAYERWFLAWPLTTDHLPYYVQAMDRRLQEVRSLSVAHPSNFWLLFSGLPTAGAQESDAPTEGPAPSETPLAQTVAELVDTTSLAIEEGQTTEDVAVTQEATTETTEAMQELASDVDVANPATVGPVAFGIQQLEELSQVAAQTPLGFLEEREREEETTNLSYEAVSVLLQKIDQQQETLATDLIADGLPKTQAEALTDSQEVIAQEAQQMLDQGNVPAAADLVQQAEAIQEEGHHFVFETPSEEQLAQWEAGEEINQAQAQKELLVAAQEQYEQLLVIDPPALEAIDTAVTSGLTSLVAAEVALSNHDAAAAVANAQLAEQVMILATENLRESTDKLTGTVVSDQTWAAVDEQFDGFDWEIVAKNNDGQVVSQITNNTQDDRAPDGLEFSVWQTLTANGWEIMAAMRGQTAIAITDNSIDDTQPKTNGSLVVWQSFGEQRSQIMLYDRHSKQTRLLSSPSVTAIEPTIVGGQISWQEWSDDGWLTRNYAPANQ